MKIAYLCLQATREGQASHAHVHEIINGLRRRGMTVDLFEPSYVNRATLPGALGRLLGILAAQLRLVFAFRKYELVYVRAHYLSFVIAFFARLFRVKTLLEVNGPINDGDDLWPMVRRFNGFFLKARDYEVKHATGIITVTPNLKVELEQVNPNVVVIPNGSNTDLFSPDRKAEPIDLPKPYIVFVGVMAKWQGIEKILSAVESPIWPDSVSLAFIGDGVDRGLVDEAATRNPHIKVLGRLPYKTVGLYLAHSLANLAVLPGKGSRDKYGASPLKLFEGMASGVPVIATDIDFMGNLVRDYQCGVVIPMDYTADELAQAVNDLAEHPDWVETMGKNGREAIVTTHSWDKRAEATYATIAETLKAV